MPSILPRVGSGSGGGFHDRSQGHMQMAIGARSAMRPNSRTETEPPPKTVGGGMMSGIGGAAAGAAIGAQYGSSGGPYGAAIGAVVGILAYALS
jgi:hypothetical protein